MMDNREVHNMNPSVNELTRSDSLERVATAELSRDVEGSVESLDDLSHSTLKVSHLEVSAFCENSALRRCSILK